MSILNKYKQWPLRIVINRSNIMDIVVSDDTTTSYKTINGCGELTKDNLIAYIDASIPNKENDSSYIESLPEYYYKEWSVSNEDICLLDDELTAYDNGLLDVDDEREFDGECEHFLLTKDDIYLTFYPIVKEEGDLELKKDSVVFNAGFLQGFYKLYGFEYQTLPQYIENNEWNLEFVIKPYEKQHDEEAIFFYMGLRGENKFAHFYNTKDSGMPDKTSNGVLLEKHNYFEIKTNNKYLPEIITGYTRDYNTEIGNNAYLIFSQNPKDYTVDTIEEFYKSDKYKKPKYNTRNDLYYNSFSLFITEDGEIGYRYLINKCEEKLEDNFIVEKTNKNVIKSDEWATINVKFKSTLPGSKCEEQDIQHKMKIYIYVNGYLKFISQELYEFNFTELDDIYQKQEMVPYNISLGGGTLGLSESKLVFKTEEEKSVLELGELNEVDEENISYYFNKRFYGELQTFKFYNGPLDIIEIRNNHYYKFPDANGCKE
jgi:hypothetical protein